MVDQGFVPSRVLTSAASKKYPPRILTPEPPFIRPSRWVLPTLFGPKFQPGRLKLPAGSLPRYTPPLAHFLALPDLPDPSSGSPILPRHRSYCYLLNFSSHPFLLHVRQASALSREGRPLTSEHHRQHRRPPTLASSAPVRIPSFPYRLANYSRYQTAQPWTLSILNPAGLHC